MRVPLPILIHLGLVTLAAAQLKEQKYESTPADKSCVDTYVQCLDNGGADNTCQSANAKCKDSCGKSYEVCLRSGADKKLCTDNHNRCLDSFTVFAATNSDKKDCAYLYNQCHEDKRPDNECKALSAQCKNKCTTIYGTALTGECPDTTAAKAQYNNCYDAFSVFDTKEVSQGVDCVSKFVTCRGNNTPNNECNRQTAQCKDKCSTIYDICLTSGVSDGKRCMNQYNNCLDSFTPTNRVDCVSSYTSCRNGGGAPNDCSAQLATCKNDASIIYDTCLTSGDSDRAACLNQYTSTLVQLDTPVLKSNTDCVTRFTKCEDAKTEDGQCQSDNAQCKNDCSSAYDTCLTSGDPAMHEPCLKAYNRCYVTLSWDTYASPAGKDCVSEYLNSKGADNERNAQAAQCKSACSTNYSTCLASGDKSLKGPCLQQYNLCLVDFRSTITTADCASSYLKCNKADNACAADAASCKNSCSVALDICQSSGDPALQAPCQKQYQSCLVSYSAAKDSIGDECVTSFVACRERGGADNECSSRMAACKNKCASVYDITRTSGDNSTIAASQSLHLYDSCLVSFAPEDVTSVGKDCGSKAYACQHQKRPDNECDSEYATCKNDCAVISDACRSSGDRKLFGKCKSLYNGCLDPSKNRNVATNSTSPVQGSGKGEKPKKYDFSTYDDITNNGTTLTTTTRPPAGSTPSPYTNDHPGEEQHKKANSGQKGTTTTRPPAGSTPAPYTNDHPGEEQHKKANSGHKGTTTPAAPPAGSTPAPYTNDHPGEEHHREANSGQKGTTTTNPPPQATPTNQATGVDPDCDDLGLLIEAELSLQ